MTPEEAKSMENFITSIGVIFIILICLFVLLIIIGKFTNHNKKRERGISITKASRQNQELINK